MKTMPLGKTGLNVSRTAFGALPIQRLDVAASSEILQSAYSHGIQFFDTARGYTDSEEKIGIALGDVRKNIFLATKSGSTELENLKRDIDTSLKNLKTDYVDLFQFHNPAQFPDDSLLAYTGDLKSSGVLRHIGITNHRGDLALQLVKSGLFETLQFPFSCLAHERDLELVQVCKEHNVGFIAMKAMAGGLIEHVRENFAFIRSQEIVVPIYGIQRMSELNEFLELEERDEPYTVEMEDVVKKEKASLSSSFCRGCGYCKPCPAEIPLDTLCRLDRLLARGVWQNFVTEQMQAQFGNARNCIDCGICNSRCPYELKPQQLSKKQYKHYIEFLQEKNILTHL